MLSIVKLSSILIVTVLVVLLPALSITIIETVFALEPVVAAGNNALLNEKLLFEIDGLIVVSFNLKTIDLIPEPPLEVLSSAE